MIRATLESIVLSGCRTFLKVGNPSIGISSQLITYPQGQDLTPLCFQIRPSQPMKANVQFLINISTTYQLYFFKKHILAVGRSIMSIRLARLNPTAKLGWPVVFQIGLKATRPWFGQPIFIHRRDHVLIAIGTRNMNKKLFSVVDTFNRFLHICYPNALPNLFTDRAAKAQGRDRLTAGCSFGPSYACT